MNKVPHLHNTWIHKVLFNCPTLTIVTIILILSLDQVFSFIVIIWDVPITWNSPNLYTNFRYQNEFDSRHHLFNFNLNRYDHRSDYNFTVVIFFIWFWCGLLFWSVFDNRCRYWSSISSHYSIVILPDVRISHSVLFPLHSPPLISIVSLSKILVHVITQVKFNIKVKVWHSMCLK